MESLEAVCAALPEVADDLRLNLQTVLRGASSLNEAQRWGVALACAYAARNAQVPPEAFSAGSDQAEGVAYAACNRCKASDAAQGER